MARYCVNATVVSDAWVYIEAETHEDATELASVLEPRDFERGDPFDVTIESVVAE